MVVHHSASPQKTTGLDDIRKWHVEDNGWDDIGYHFVISGLGIAHKGRDLTFDGAHALANNDGSVGVCVVGNNTKTDHRWYREQVIALHRLWNALQIVYPGIDAFGHRDLVSSTECPGLDVRPLLFGPRF